MISGQGALSVRRDAVGNEKNPSNGFTKTVFAHKATAGATGINLSALTVPTEMTGNGFSNPSTATLLGASLFLYPKNLKLVSTLRPAELIQNLTFNITSSSQITFLGGFTALEGEIFIGTIDYNQTNGVRVVDARSIVATGTIAAAGTDFNVGNPFTINQNSTAQVGAVLVFVDGVLQARNTGNSTTVLDGNYYEVPIAGSNLASVIRMNVAHPTAVRNVVVVSNGLLMERPDGSMSAAIEAIAGMLNNAAAYLSPAIGQSVATILGASPSYVDLKAFGDRVVALETRATVDETPTSQTDVIATRLGQKVYLHGTAYNGSIAPTVTNITSLTSFVVRRAMFIPYQMQDGSWRMRFNIIAVFSPISLTSTTLSINGVTFKNFTNALQSISGSIPGSASPAVQTAYANGNASTVTVDTASGGTSSQIIFSGDVELDSKPTWAY